MTYLLDDALYIVHGFGMQETGGLQHTGAGIVPSRKMQFILRRILSDRENGAKVEENVSAIRILW